MISFLRDLFFKDFWLKLFSLALATVIWTTVTLAIKNEVSPLPALGIPTDVRTFYNLPVLVLSSAGDVRAVKVEPEQVAITVQGEPKILQNLQGKEIRALADLTGIVAASNLTRRIEVSAPAGVTHVRIVPPEVKIVFPAKH
jgi:YbbR domain-containing protein